MVSASTETLSPPSWASDHDHHDRPLDHDLCFSNVDKLGLDGKRPRRVADNRTGEEQQMVMVYRRRAQAQHISSDDHHRTQQVMNTQKVCVDCKATKTPLWRSGPFGAKSLCNACGIRYRKQRRKTELEMKKNRAGVRGDDKKVVLESETEETKAALLLMALSWS